MGQNVTLDSVLFLFYTHLPVRSGGDHPIGCFRHILFDNEAERVKKRKANAKGEGIAEFWRVVGYVQKKGSLMLPFCCFAQKIRSVFCF